MTKIRTFFGLGRKPKKKRERKEKIRLPDNFIFGSTNQNTPKEDLPKSESTDKQKKQKALR